MADAKVLAEPGASKGGKGEINSQETNNFLITTSFTRDRVKRLGTCDGSKTTETLN